MGRATPFFATRSDILEVLARLEETMAVKYVLAGMRSSPIAEAYSSASEIETFGIASTGDHAQEQTFLIAAAEIEILAREVPQRRGGSLFSFDQKKNPDTVGVCPGGRFDERTLISGQFGPSTGSPDSAMLHAVIMREFKRRFRKVKSYWVGRDAASLLERGFRLTPNIKAAEQYDLQP